nr:MAG TPA: hypothetical protein [Caudoviricetes sp.]
MINANENFKKFFSELQIMLDCKRHRLLRCDHRNLPISKSGRRQR